MQKAERLNTPDDLYIYIRKDIGPRKAGPERVTVPVWRKASAQTPEREP